MAPWYINACLAEWGFGSDFILLISLSYPSAECNRVQPDVPTDLACSTSLMWNVGNINKSEIQFVDFSKYFFRIPARWFFCRSSPEMFWMFHGFRNKKSWGRLWTYMYLLLEFRRLHSILGGLNERIVSWFREGMSFKICMSCFIWYSAGCSQCLAEYCVKPFQIRFIQPPIVGK